jgi:hypothetical protein
VIGQLTWSIQVGETILEVLNDTGSINIDDQNIPAITTSVLVPFDQAVLDALDPRTVTVPRVILRGEYTEWMSRPISAMSAYATAEGGTIADLSAAWAGMQIHDVSELFGAPLYSGANDNPTSMELDLHVREVVYDDFEMNISLASDEALLIDWAPSSIWDVAELSEQSQSFNLDVAASWANLMLGAVFGTRLDPSPYNTVTVSSGFSKDLLEAISQNAYEMLRPALEDADLKLRVNPNGRGFSLQRPENNIKSVQGWTASPDGHLFEPQDVLSVKRVTTRTGDWYDAVMLTQDGVGGGFGYPRGPHTRTYLERLDEGFGVSDSMAQNIYRRVTNRGEFIDITAPIRLGVFMTDDLAYLPEGEVSGPEHQWRIKAVTYDMPSGTMSIRAARPY